MHVCHQSMLRVGMLENVGLCVSAPFTGPRCSWHGVESISYHKTDSQLCCAGAHLHPCNGGPAWYTQALQAHAAAGQQHGGDTTSAPTTINAIRATCPAKHSEPLQASYTHTAYQSTSRLSEPLPTTNTRRLTLSSGTS